MEFRIADTFTDSLDKLTDEEQKAVKTTAFDLQMNPSNPGMKFHKLDRAKDKNFWSVRVSQDIRLIVYRMKKSLMLCFAGHHDDAYRWGERRRLEVHPKTGAAQLIEVQETVREVFVPEYKVKEPKKATILTNVTDDELLNYGIPHEWLDKVREASEDALLELAEHLPGEAAEALLDLAVGKKPQISYSTADHFDPFEHPDAKRRFRVMSNVEELKRAMDFPWDKWAIFLHPEQQKLVEKEYNGPARISGSAGTGKTVVALHRAVYLARTHPDTRILLTTFSDSLANAVRKKLFRLIEHEPRIGECIEVYSMNEIGKRLYERNLGSAHIAPKEEINEIFEGISFESREVNFSLHFLIKEWEDVVDAWQLEMWEEYRDVMRLGRKTRLPESRRSVLWSDFEQVWDRLKSRNLITESAMFHRLASFFSKRNHVPFDFIVVDEAQDVSIAQLQFLAALGGNRPNGLFFTGDLGQRIFQQPFSWKALGVDIRGRSRTLRINYRTSHQIRWKADLLLPTEISDVDGNEESREGTVSAFNGPEPVIEMNQTMEMESDFVGRWICDQIRDKNIPPDEIGVFVRSPNEIVRACKALERVELPFAVLGEDFEEKNGCITVSTMHLAKGLEFRAVVVMACDDEVIPSQERMELIADESDLEDVYNTERHLLYVACTRAREELLVTGVDPASEFLDDLLV